MPSSPAYCAGSECWPRLFYNLRSSCETKLLEKFSTHFVARRKWHDAKGLKRPTTKESKQKLLAQIKELYDQGKQYQEIGAVVGLCARSVKPLFEIILLLWVFKCLMADQGNDLGVENLDLLKRL